MGGQVNGETYTRPPNNLAWIVTTREPSETMTTTLVNTEREWVGGAFTTKSISQVRNSGINLNVGETYIDTEHDTKH